MKNSGDHHQIAVDLVKYAMALLDHATNFQTVVGTRFSKQRKIFELGEDVIDPALIGFSHFITEPFCAERIDLDQIETRVLSKPNSSHVARGARR